MDIDDHKGDTGERGEKGERGRRGVEGSGVQGVQGVQGNQGVQGFQGSGERGEQGERGERGPVGRSGRTRLQRRAFFAYLLLVAAATASAAIGVYNYNQIQDGRKLGLTVTCAFASAISEQGRKTLTGAVRAPRTAEERKLERIYIQVGLGTWEERLAEGRRKGAEYVRQIIQRVEKDTKTRGLIVRRGPDAGSLDCDALRRATVR